MQIRLSSLNSKVLAYISTTFAYGIMHHIFNIYYTKVFLEKYNLSPDWYSLSQIIFMVWNAINDPLFGYLQDHANCKIFQKRRLSILYGAPFYGLSFLVAWIPFSNDGVDVPQWVVGIHLISALCLYDTMFTFVLLAHCCLVTEMEVDFQSRFNIKWWSVIASFTASLIVPITVQISDNLRCLTCFRWTCVFVAIIAILCLVYTGLFAHTVYDSEKRSIKKEETGNIFQFTFDILKMRDFHGFVWLNFLHQGHSVFQSNFIAIFLDFLVPGLTSYQRTLYFFIYTTLPSLTVILFKIPIVKLGYYRSIQISCLCKIVVGLCAWLIGRNPIVYLVFMLIDNLLVHSISCLLDLPLSDIADKDKLINKRSKPMSSMVFGTNALITKPAISLFPMFAVKILAMYGYASVVKKTATNKNKLDLSVTSKFGEALPDVIYSMACLVPVMVGILQLISWSFYSMKTSHQRSGPLNVDQLNNDDRNRMNTNGDMKDNI